MERTVGTQYHTPLQKEWVSECLLKKLARIDTTLTQAACDATRSKLMEEKADEINTLFDICPNGYNKHDLYGHLYDAAWDVIRKANAKRAAEKMHNWHMQRTKPALVEYTERFFIDLINAHPNIGDEFELEMCRAFMKVAELPPNRDGINLYVRACKYMTNEDFRRFEVRCLCPSSFSVEEHMMTLLNEQPYKDIVQRVKGMCTTGILQQ